MAATEGDVKIDLDALDAEVAKGRAPDAKIRVEDTKPPASETKSPADETIEVVRETKPPAREVLTPDAGLEKLKKQLDEEKQRADNEKRGREDAERREREAVDAEVKARTEVQGSQLDLVTTAIATIKQSNEALKAAYRQARTEGDLDKEWDLQQTMSENAAKLIQLEAGKTALEKQPKPQPRPQTDQVEQFCARLTPTSASWVRSHPDYVRDPKKNRAMLAAHELAMSQDVPADTPEYFASIEKTLGLTQAKANGASQHVDLDDDPTAAGAQQVRQTAPPSAPVSRSGRSDGQRANVVTLSAEEVEMAELMFPDSKNPAAEYAKNKVALRKEGKLN